MSESLEGSVERIPPYGLLRDETRQDGESGTERDKGYVPNARANGRPQSLAYSAPCRYCSAPIYVAMCRDGKWRTFDPATVPAADAGVWAWRKTWGMEEQGLVPGKRLHYCAERARPNLAPWDR